MIRDAILSPAFWETAYREREAHPLLLLRELPSDLATAALPVAAAAFPLLLAPHEPIPTDTATSAGFGAGRFHGSHSLSTWPTDPFNAPPATSYAASIGRSIRQGRHNLRRNAALLWRDVRDLLIPAATGELNRGPAFAAAALAALDTLIAQQGFRDKPFMDHTRDRLANGDQARLLPLLPQSRANLASVEYIHVLPHEHDQYLGRTADERRAIQAEADAAEVRRHAEEEAEAERRRDEQRRLEALAATRLAAAAEPDTDDEDWEYGTDEADLLCPICDAPIVAGAYQYCDHFVALTDHEGYYQYTQAAEELGALAGRLVERYSECEDVLYGYSDSAIPSDILTIFHSLDEASPTAPATFWLDTPGVRTGERVAGAYLAQSAVTYYFHADPPALVARSEGGVTAALAWLDSIEESGEAADDEDEA